MLNLWCRDIFYFDITALDWKEYTNVYVQVGHIQKENLSIKNPKRKQFAQNVILYAGTFENKTNGNNVIVKDYQPKNKNIFFWKYCSVLRKLTIAGGSRLSL